MKRPFGDKSSPIRLVLLGLALAACFLAWQSPSLSPEESALYSRIRQAQNLLWSEMERQGQADPLSDPDHSGFIGLDWSETSTTLGNLEAKRASCDPLWGVMALRWFDTLGLAKGERIVVVSSSSFPGMLYSILAAAESRNLKIDLLVSLGSSAWGANRPEAPWPVLARVLLSHNFLRTRPLFYTLGGNGETAQGMFPEGVRILTNAALNDGVELYAPAQTDLILDRKMALIAPGTPEPAKMVINIGGGQTSLGTDEGVITLKNGLLSGDMAREAGNGVIAKSLENYIPVLHLLNVRSLAKQVGINAAKRQPFFLHGAMWPALAGVVLFLLILATHKRWSWDEEAVPPGKSGEIPRRI